ncbi:hypothetical protein KC717_00350 [Candidatus Dojkabacteria bacterium]|uniref:Transcription regulator TrmB N-terminal domain-containing protein n=1 Tax=Candidatus Dojkabacteria bacterium TaxID=2099670 RepID=A0A955RK49_9BACT|nr:hypothetical protein [Candidatus Dojkabacteria bacterium]
MDIRPIFENLGLSEEQAVIYMTLLKAGRMRMIDVAKETEIPRTSCYEYVPKLIELNLVQEIMQGKSKFYQATSPENLLDKAYSYKNDFSFNLKSLENQFQDLRELYNVHYGGKSIRKIEGLVEILEHMKNLDTATDQLKILYSNSTMKKVKPELRKFLESAVNTYESVEVDDHPIDKNKVDVLIKFILNDRVLLFNVIDYVLYELQDPTIVAYELEIFKILST